jgi:hypothetical protein
MHDRKSAVLGAGHRDVSGASRNTCSFRDFISIKRRGPAGDARRRGFPPRSSPTGEPCGFARPGVSDATPTACPRGSDAAPRRPTGRLTGARPTHPCPAPRPTPQSPRSHGLEKRSLRPTAGALRRTRVHPGRPAPPRAEAAEDPRRPAAVVLPPAVDRRADLRLAAPLPAGGQSHTRGAGMTRGGIWPGHAVGVRARRTACSASHSPTPRAWTCSVSIRVRCALGRGGRRTSPGG